MSNFVEKIGEKLHIGGHKKEGEHPPPHAGDHGGHGEPHTYGGHTEQQHGSHPEHGYGGEHHGEAGHGGCGDAHGEHGGHHEQHGVGVPPPHHEGPLEKVKHKVKGKKHGEGHDDSSSSSSESDGEGGRRKKKHGLF